MIPTIPPYISQIVVTSLLPTILDEIKDFFSGPIKPEDAYKKVVEAIKPKKRMKQRKPVDKSILTTAHFDEVILLFYARQTDNKKAGRILKTQCDITKELNILFGMTKSLPIYSAIWSGRASRASYPEGNETFNHKV